MSRGKWAAVAAVLCLALIVVVAKVVTAQMVSPQSVVTTEASSQRYYLVSLPISGKGGAVGYDLYLLDSQAGRVWVWAHQKERELVGVPLVEKPTKE
jgi:hypothetical protein